MKQLIFSILFILCLTSVAKEQRSPLRVIAVADGYPFSYTLPNGELSGLFVEFWQLWSEINDYPIIFELHDFSDGLEQLDSENTIFSGLFKNASRSEKYQFSLPFFKVDTGIIYNRTLTDKGSLYGAPLRIAVIKSSFQQDYINTYHPNHEVVLLDKVDDAVPMLLNESIDALMSDAPLLSSFLIRHQLNGVLKLSDDLKLTNEVHAAVSDANQKIIAQINDGINNIPLNDLVELEKKWLLHQDSFYQTNRFSALLTSNELQWLKKNKIIRLATQPATYPLGFLDSQGIFSGLVGEYVRHIKDAIGIQYNFVHHDSWAHVFDNFQNQNVDLVSAIVNTSERADSINFTIPYFSTPNVIVTRNDSSGGKSLASLVGKKIGISDGYLVTLIEQDFPDINIVVTANSDQALTMVADGELDAAIEAITVVNHEIAQSQHHNLIISSLTPYNFELSMAVRQGMEPLVGILNKIIADITVEENELYTNKWLPSYVKTGIEVSTIIYWTIPLMIVVMVLVLLMMFKNNLQLKQLVERNRYLARRIVAVQENERKALSADLHDEIGQNLTALQLQVDAAKAFSNNVEMTNFLDDINNLTMITYNSTQDLMHGLRPLVLNEYGLDRALSNQVITKLLDESNITYHKTFVGNFDDLSEEITTNMYRIAQECITNTSKHSNAENLYVICSRSRQYLRMSIEDDGIGFDIENVQQNSHGLGLNSIQDRVDTMAGTFTVRSSSEGTAYEFSFPLTQ